MGLTTFAARARGFVLPLLLLASVFGADAATRPPRDPKPAWTLVELGELTPGGGAIPQGMNDRGDIVGYSRTADGNIHPFLWQNGVMRDLGRPPGAEPNSGATAVSDDGVVIANDNENGPFTWRDGQWTALPFAGHMSDINKKHAIVGVWQNHVGGGRAFMYQEGVFRDIGTLGGPTSNAQGVNDKGVIVGVSQAWGTGDFHAFTYEGGRMRDLGTLGGNSSIAHGINDRGLIVGESEEPGGRRVSFVSDGRTMRRLFDAPGSTHSALAINNAGAIIGNIDDTTYLYEKGVPTRLDTLDVFRNAGWTRVFAMDINDHGWITGWGWRAGGPVTGVAFLLIPR